MAQGFVPSVLKTSKNRDGTALLGNLHCCCTVLIGRKVSIYLQSELVLFQCMPTVSRATVRLPRAWLRLPNVQVGEGCSEVPPKPSLLQTEAAPSLRLPSQGRCSSP